MSPRWLYVLIAAACSSESERKAAPAPAPKDAAMVAVTADAAERAEADDAAPDDDDEPRAAARVLQVDMDGKVTCVRRTDGGVRCWGTQRGGAWSPTPVDVAVDLEAAAIELAGDTLTIVTRAGAVQAGPLHLPAAIVWTEVLGPGDVIDVLDDGDRTYVLTRQGDVRVLDGSAATVLTNVVSLSSRARGQVDALHRDGRVSTIAKRAVSPVKGLTDAEALFGTRCARRRDGAATCWTARGKPAPWKGPGNILDRAVAGGVTCDLTGSGVACAGANEVGQLGTGAGPDRKQPRIVDLPAKPAQLAAGDRSWCAVLESGVLACWGANDGGQLGDGTLIDRPTPLVIGGATSAKPPPPPAGAIPVAGADVAMDWSGIPEGCKRPTTLAAPDDGAPLDVTSAYALPDARGLVVWFADFQLEPGGYRPGYPVTRGAQRAIALVLGKGKGKRSQAIDRGRYRGSDGARRSELLAHHGRSVDRFAADVLVEKVDRTWICGTLLDPDDPKRRTPFAARLKAPRFRTR